MFKRISILFIALVSIIVVAPCSAEDKLDQRFEALQLKVQKLEERIKMLETAAVKADLVKRDESEALESISPWIQLKLGLTQAKVRELLGQPSSIRKGAMDEYWYYSPQGKNGPYVKFMFLKVDSWKVPDNIESE